MPPYLVSGLASFADAIDLSDGVSTFYPATMQSGAGGVSMPGGITFSPHPRGVFAQAGQQPSNTITVTQTVIIGTPYVGQQSQTNALEAVWHAIDAKLEQARRACGDSPVGTPVYYAYHWSGAAEETRWLVVDGILQRVPSGEPDGAPHLWGVLTLFVRPYGFGAQLADAVSATRTNGDPVNAPLYRAAVPGDVQAMVKLLITDQSTSSVYINRLLGFVRSSRPMAATDWSPIYVPTATGAGVTHTDATSWGGSCPRLAGATSSWQTFATMPSNNGARQNGRYDAWAVLRDSSSPLNSPTWPLSSAATPSGAGGNLLDGQYLAVMTTHDGSGNESTPLGSAFATVPITQSGSIFYDGFEGGDLALWDGTFVSFGGNGTEGTLDITTAASYPLDAPGNQFGLRAQAAVGTNTSPAIDQGGQWVYKAMGATTGAMRFRMRINSNTGAGYNVIPLVLNSSHSPILSLISAGGGWTIGGPIGGIVYQAGIGQGDWIQHVEVRITAYAGGSATVNLYVNDVLTVNQSISVGTAPAFFALGAYCNNNGIANSNLGLQVDFDDVQMTTAATSIGANTGSIVYDWTAPGSGLGTGYNLYVQRNFGSWQKIAVSGTTYTLTSNTAGTVVTSPPLVSTSPQFGQFRLQYGVKGSAPIYQYTTPVSVELGSAWQRVRIAEGVVLPPQAPQFGKSPAGWVVNLQGISGDTNNPNLDAALVWLAPCDEPCGFEASAPGASLAQLGQWQIDIDPNGYVSGQIYNQSGSTLLQAATVSGQFQMGPGDTITALLAEVSDGSGHYVVDMVHAQYTIQQLITPCYNAPAGAR